MSDDARAVVLARIRASLRDVADGREPSTPSSLHPVAVLHWDGAPTAQQAAAPLARAERFVDRVEDYRATVTRCTADEVEATVEAICDRHGAHRIALAAGVPDAWVPAALEALPDDPPLDVAMLDRVDGVLTGAALGIAETGTIVLDGAPRSGRRALTLVPDLHVCVVLEADLVDDVPDAMASLAAAAADGRPVTWVSGPSATSDIELDRVEGVHGPRRLEVVLVGS